ncbi:MAG: hypothetical protein IJG68_04095 [Bacilli bacterium]|nr:hypothetical protein [Bacilli bacterium]
MEKNKRENERKRRLFLAILMILFVGVILTTSTYAWFTANQTVTVSNVNVNIEASNGIQISADGANWKTVLSNADITGASTTYSTAVNQLPSSMVPVSTGKTIDSDTGFMNMFRGEIVDGGSGTNVLTSTKSTEVNGTNGDFVAFDVFFKVTEAKQIYLTNASKVTTTDDPTKGIENAARIAFLPEGTVDASTAVADIQTQKTAGTPIIWEPNNNAHTQAGLNNASSVYGLTTLTATGEVANYYGVIAEFAKADNVALNATTAGKFTQVTPDIKTGTTGILSTAYQPVFQLQAGITKMRIYMWIEGQDVDCEDAASGSNLTYALQFSLLNKAS